MQYLYLIRGLPGSGKSTLAKNIKQLVGAVGVASGKSIGTMHVETDEFFTRHVNGKEVYDFDRRLIGAAHDECYGRTMRYLHMGYDVAVSNVFSTNRELARYICGIERSGIEVLTQVVRCWGPWKSVHNVPERTISRMRERFENFPGEMLYNWEQDNG